MNPDPNDPLIQPDVIPLHAAAADPVIVPSPSTLFVDRADDAFGAKRDGQRAFFAFMASLSRAQHAAATTIVPRGLPGAASLATRHAHRRPILPAELSDRDPSRVAALRRVLAASIGSVCPCCGSLPVASVRRIGGLQQGLRFLVCSWCATQRHLVRIECGHCESTAGIGDPTRSTDPDGEAGNAAAIREVVEAAVCDEWASDPKLIALEADANADRAADDLATIALDLLTGERGDARVGPNHFTHPGVPVT